MNFVPLTALQGHTLYVVPAPCVVYRDPVFSETVIQFHSGFRLKVKETPPEVMVLFGDNDYEGAVEAEEPDPILSEDDDIPY